MKAGDVPFNWRGASSAPAKGRGLAPVMQPAGKAGRGRPAGKGKGKS
jgi:hypothetical protein